MNCPKCSKSVYGEMLLSWRELAKEEEKKSQERLEKLDREIRLYVFEKEMLSD